MIAPACPLLLVGMEDNYGDDWHIRENDDSQYMSLLEAGLDGASLTLMERAHGTARWRSERGESKPIELVHDINESLERYGNDIPENKED